MYYIEQNNKIILFDENKEKLQNTIAFMPQYQELEILETEKDIILFDEEFYFVDDEIYLAKQEQKEIERIQSLSMTRSDFFDGTIKAFGITQAKLKNAIEIVLASVEISEIEKTIAMNNYDNALNFYRKHPLFDLLSGMAIPISEDLSITITKEQWDKFFDESNKKSPDAYKALLPQS